MVARKRAVLERPDAGIRREVELIAGQDDEILVSSMLPSQGARAGIVICPGLFNDVPRNHRREHLLARELATAGFVASRFDYSGTANSGAVDRAVTYRSMRDDATQVTRHVEDSLGMPVTGFLGTRVGAIVAAAQARERAGARLALWDPVLDGDGYVRDALRSRLMADMRRDPEHRMTPDQLNGALDRGDEIDLVGYGLDRGLRDSLKGLALRATMGGDKGPVLLVQFSRRPKLRAVYENLAHDLRSSGRSLTRFVFEHDEQWWFTEDVTRMDDTELIAAPLIATTTKWFADTPGAESSG